MVLDINIVRNEPELVRKSQRDRFKDPSIIDRLLEIDENWKRETFNGDNLKKLKNICSKEIGRKMKAKQSIGDSEIVSEEIHKNLINLKAEDISELSIGQIKVVSRLLDAAIVTNGESVASLDETRQKTLNEIGNILHKSVIISANEDDNGLIRVSGDTSTRKPHSHIDLIEMIDGVSLVKGTRVAGSRCYYLTGACVNLETALVTFGVLFLANRQYTGLSPPIFMNKDAMQQVAQLSQFDTELYKVVCKRNEDQSIDAGEEEKYLIATSEQPIAFFNCDEWIPKSELPIRYMGVSECLRQEVGSHGRDTRGIFRVHQFKKIEQFCLTSPHDDESEKMFHEMIGTSEQFYQQLGIPYQVVSIVSGELNNAAAIKYDLEGWFPGSGAFRELVSCSNCTDYQARSVLTRFGETKLMNQSTEYVHMLNCTLTATTRTLCAILENYQTETGIVVPEVLRPFMSDDFREFIPFVKQQSGKKV